MHSRRASQRRSERVGRGILGGPEDEAVGSDDWIVLNIAFAERTLVPCAVGLQLVAGLPLSAAAASTDEFPHVAPRHRWEHDHSQL